MIEERDIQSETVMALTADIVAAHVSNNEVGMQELSPLIADVHKTLVTISKNGFNKPLTDPAVPIKSSIKNDYIICLEDGKKLKMLKRHLMTHYGMTPEDYRTKWSLPADYPMVAPSYAIKRRELAKKIGLGRKPGSKNKKKK